MYWIIRTIISTYRNGISLTSWFIVLLLTISCNEPNSLPENQLRLSFMADPTSLDPRKGGDFISATLHCMVYEGLTRCSPGGHVELALAKSIELSSDQRTYTFHLRDAVWTDGNPVRAQDFERAWKSLLDPSFPSLCSYLLFPLRNAQECAKGEVSPEAVGIRAIDDKTLQVELERPTPYFISLTAFPLLLPIPSHLEAPGEVFNGPFCIDRLVPQQEIALSKNPSYWNLSAVTLDAIHISILPHETTSWQLFEQGQLDWIGGAIAPISPDVIDSIQNRLEFHPIAATTFCSFNTQTFPFQNAHLRRAFSYSIQRKELAQRGQVPAERCLPPSLSHRKEEDLTDWVKARQSLELGLQELQIEAKDLDGLVLYFKGGQIDKRLAQTLQKQWKEVLGVSVKLQELDFKSHMERLHTKNYQLSIGSWIAQIHDPLNILERFAFPKNPKNFPGWNHPDYQELIEKIRMESKERSQWIERAEQILLEEMPITPLYHWSNPSLSKEDLEGLITTPSGGILFDRCKKKVNIR
jgi:oligopeptide transport system substrate-binding protein